MSIERAEAAQLERWTDVRRAFVEPQCRSCESHTKRAETPIAATNSWDILRSIERITAD
jgi:hypothetical protein